MKTILMTSPASFGVQYEINPWMEGNTGAVDINKAVQQWSELRNSMLVAGVDVVVLPKSPDYCPDAVFTANAGLIYKNKFISSRFRHDERAVEEPFFINWFRAHHYEIVDTASIEATRTVTSFEGAGDALFNINRNILWMGFGFRTSLSFKTFFDQCFDKTDVIVRPLQLVDPRFYHLDTCFCPTDLGHVIWYPKAFDEHAQYVIESWYSTSLIDVSEEDAINFACNAVSCGKDLFMPKISAVLRARLTELGYTVWEHDMSEFLKSGGACKCLTLEVIE
jgi:N-dimethylarginine dimethylaminohydrolase